jgi:hypothetical protein
MKDYVMMVKVELATQKGTHEERQAKLDLLNKKLKELFKNDKELSKVFTLLTEETDTLPIEQRDYSSLIEQLQKNEEPEEELGYWERRKALNDQLAMDNKPLPDSEMY